MPIKHAYQLPLIGAIFPSKHNASCFVQMDLLMGFHQIRVHFEYRSKHDFLVDKGLNVFNGMPFGLCSAASTFQRVMDGILCDQSEKI